MYTFFAKLIIYIVNLKRVANSTYRIVLQIIFDNTIHTTSFDTTFPPYRFVFISEKQIYSNEQWLTKCKALQPYNTMH